jgi:hypothetical protein
LGGVIFKKTNKNSTCASQRESKERERRREISAILMSKLSSYCFLSILHNTIVIVGKKKRKKKSKSKKEKILVCIFPPLFQFDIYTTNNKWWPISQNSRSVSDGNLCIIYNVLFRLFSFSVFFSFKRRDYFFCCALAKKLIQLLLLLIIFFRHPIIKKKIFWFCCGPCFLYLCPGVMCK